MVTSGVIYHILRLLSLPVDIRNICVLLAPGFSGLTAYAMYLLTSEMSSSPSAGLLAAAFMAITPGYISRSVAGSYDNEAIAIFLLVFTFFLWIKAVKVGSIMWGALAALFYGYMVSAWGGYVFITNLIPLHVFVLILMGRFSSRVYIAYNTWYALGTLASMQVPFVGFLPIRSSDHMAALGIFGLLQLVGFFDFLRNQLPGKQFQTLLVALGGSIFVIAFGGLILLTVTGTIAPWSGRFYSLWDTGYAKIHIPIIASVSEHQPTAWPAFFFDLNFLIWLFPAGVYMCFRNLRDEHVFVVIYAVLASYFAGVMVRLMLTLSPIVCCASALALSHVLDSFLTAKSPAAPAADTNGANGSAKQPSSNASFGISKSIRQPVIGIYSLISKSTIASLITGFLLVFVAHCTWVTSNAYSSPSVVLASRMPDGSQHIIDDYREAYYWLRQNTPPDAKIMSWWDYGYQIGGMADRPTLVDNNTWNNTHIATVGKAMSSREEVSYPILRQHDVDYVLIIFGGLLGYSGDDINKFLWMVRIAEGIWPEEVKERDFFTARGEYRVVRIPRAPSRAKCHSPSSSPSPIHVPL
jgi:dolichyl-diphosphooligosaccharide---protein glycosyltransferase